MSQIDYSKIKSRITAGKIVRALETAFSLMVERDPIVSTAILTVVWLP